MFKERNLYIFLVICFVLYVVSDYYAPKPIDWTITFGESDKRPFGSYILYENLDDFFPEKQVSFETFYEQEGEIQNQLILSTTFAFSETDSLALMESLQQGATVLIGAESFRGKYFRDQGIETDYYISIDYQDRDDSMKVVAGEETYYYPGGIMQSYFKLSSDTDWKTLAASDNPIMIGKKIGKGRLILLSTPLIFSNYGLLQGNSYEFAGWVLNQLPNEPLIYNRYYLAGKPEPRTPFRYLLSEPPLRAALYLTMVLLLTVIIVNSQYQRKPIPVFERPANTTLHFIRTVGGLYHQEGDHRKTAGKLIANFLYDLKSRHNIHSLEDTDIANKIATIYQVRIEKTRQLIDQINEIQRKSTIQEKELIELYKKLQLFKRV